jgi:uncharacterized protein
MELREILNDVEGFDWDSGNVDKNLTAHGVKNSESEEVFFNDPLIVFTDVKHSQEETRYYCLGRTNELRKLFVVFTLRAERIRIISARDMHKKERYTYEKEIKKNS